ncbi:hypothetical protein Y1Q_0010075 [Alligator mississippiensis]|uniref:Uncharacterized protein n=1 Tax=Alligator mississippiensis TaxID=8496 RepID=A0A151MG64_ALLMI|nr:hypothetical protein Y1Q_0010075 [Alligator mississippiensis]
MTKESSVVALGRPLILLPALATMEAIHGHILDLEELEILARTRSDPNSNPPPEGVAHSASAGTKQSPQGPHSCPDPGLPLCLHGASCWLYGSRGSPCLLVAPLCSTLCL